MSGKRTLGTKDLVLRRGVDHAAIYVPPRLRAAMGGKSVLRKGVGTRNLKEAIRLSGSVLQDFRAQLADAANRAQPSPALHSSVEWLNSADCSSPGQG